MHNCANWRTFARLFSKLMLKNILSISGKPGLYKLLSRGANMLVVESLVDQKRMPAYTRDKLVALSDISMFTTDEDMPLSEVLQRTGDKYAWKAIDGDIKKLDNAQLFTMFGEIVENFDRDRVYPTDVRKLFMWYNLLIQAGFTDFRDKEEDTEDKAEVKEAPKAEEKQQRKKSVTKSVKTTQAAVKTAAKTGVGAKKG